MLTRRLLIAAVVGFAVAGGAVDQFVNWFSRDEHQNRSVTSAAIAVLTYGAVGGLLTRFLVLRMRQGQPPSGWLAGAGVGVLCGVASLLITSVVCSSVLSPESGIRPAIARLPSALGMMLMWLPALIAASAWPVLVSTVAVGATVGFVNGRRKWVRKSRMPEG